MAKDIHKYESFPKLHSDSESEVRKEIKVDDLLKAKRHPKDLKAASSDLSNRYYLLLTPVALFYPMTQLYQKCVDAIKSLPIEQGWMIREHRTVMGFSFYLAPGVQLPVDKLSAEWGFNSECGGAAIEVFPSEVPQMARGILVLERPSIDEDHDELDYTSFELLMAGEDPFEVYGTDDEDPLDDMDGLDWLHLTGL